MDTSWRRRRLGAGFWRWRAFRSRSRRSALRIVGTGLCVQYWDPSKGEGFFHEFSGWVMFVISLGLLYLVHKAMHAVRPHEVKHDRGTILGGGGLAGGDGRSAEQPGRSRQGSCSGGYRAHAGADRCVVGRDLPIDAEVLGVLGKGDFLNRVYRAGPDSPSIGLFIGYFPDTTDRDRLFTLRSTVFRGAGWTFDSSKYTSMTAANGTPYQVGEYIISNGETKQFVLYWYQSMDAVLRTNMYQRRT